MHQTIEGNAGTIPTDRLRYVRGGDQAARTGGRTGEPAGTARPGPDGHRALRHSAGRAGRLQNSVAYSPARVDGLDLDAA
jgi:hypothetical protein